MSRAISKVVVESLLFVRHRVDDGVIECKSGLLGDRLENDKIALRKGSAHRAIGKSEGTEILFSVESGAAIQRCSAKALPRSFANSGAAESSLKQTDWPAFQTRPMTPSPGVIGCSRR